jgi:hypothetical protein
MPDVNTVAVGAPYNDTYVGVGSNSGHVRVYSATSICTISQAQQGSDIDGVSSHDYFGGAVSMADANTMAVGATYNDGNGSESGQVRIYERISGVWTQKGSAINGESAGDYSGWSVSMPSTNIVAIGSGHNNGNGLHSGHVRIYTWNGSAWVQKGGDIDGESAGDYSGQSVSMPDDNTVAIGAIYNDGSGTDAGHVRIYTWNGSAWVKKGLDIDGESAGDYFGASVSMFDANTVAIGAPNNDGGGSNSGHVRIYTWGGSSWTQKGGDIDGEAAGDESGWSISMPDANTVAVGAIKNDGSGTDAGHARVYSWICGSWVQKGVDIDGEAAGDESGQSVSMPDAHTIAIGALKNDGNGTDAGHVRIYIWNNTTWVQKGADIDGEAAGDISGRIDMPDVNTVAVGAPYNDTYVGVGSNSGHVRVYNVTSTCVVYKQKQIGSDIDGEAAYDQSGFSVSMPDSNTIAIGAPYNSGNSYDDGQVRVFERSGNTWVQKGADIDGVGFEDHSGWSVSMPNANTLAIAAPDGGYVRVYSWLSGAWVQKGSTFYSKFYSVSMPDSNTVAMGDPLYSPLNGAGRVLIYSWSGSAWVQKGADINGEAYDDNSGYSISMPDVNTIAIGGRENSDAGTEAGHVRVYKWNGSSWVQRGVDIDGEAAGDHSGWSVSMPDSNTVAIGAPQNDANGSNKGQVRVYKWNGTNWTQKGEDIDGPSTTSYFGGCLSMPDDNTIAIGTRYGSHGVRVYKWSGQNWVQMVATIYGEMIGLSTSESVCMPDSNTLGIGEPVNQGANGLFSGHVPVYSLLSNFLASGFGKTAFTGVDETQAEKQLAKAYPNPTQGGLYIELDKVYKDLSVSIKNIMGQEVIFKRFGTTDKIEIMIDQSSGIFFVEVKTGGDRVSKIKVLKE